MAKPFDATLNAMIDLQPAAWASCFGGLVGIPPGPSTIVDTDLATTLQADKIFRIDGERPSLLHLELEANPRTGIPRELMRYNTLIDHQHDLPVETVLILLRPKALASDQSGLYRRCGVGGATIAEFRYRVERVWERTVEFWLGHGVGLAPLALLTDEADADLERALTRVRECLSENDTEATVAKSLLGSSYVLCGLRYNRNRIADLFRRLSMLMEDSTTYQEILGKGLSQGLSQGLIRGRDQGLAEGKMEAKRELLLRLGAKKFGPPMPTVAERIREISDSNRLTLLLEKVLDVVSWDDLLAD